jgi:hypothetical protein
MLYGLGRSFYGGVVCGSRMFYCRRGGIVFECPRLRTYFNVVALQSRGTIAKDHPIDASKVEYSYNPLHDHLQHSFICRFAQDKETLLLLNFELTKQYGCVLFRSKPFENSTLSRKQSCNSPSIVLWYGSIG